MQFIRNASIHVGVSLLGALELFFNGILEEYVLHINTRTMKKPRAVIGELLNFDQDNHDTSQPTQMEQSYDDNQC